MATWVLVANSATSNIYSSDNLRIDGLHLVKEIIHPDSRKKVADLVSDQPGHYKTDSGQRGSFIKNSPKEIEAEHFAVELSKELKKGYDQKLYDNVVIVAPAPFSSLIAKHLQINLLKVTHIAKDYTKYPIKKLTETLKEHLFV